jgi:hypothetical protein
MSAQPVQGTDTEILNNNSEYECRLQGQVKLPKRPQGVVEVVRVLFEAMSVLSEAFIVFIEAVRVLWKVLRALSKAIKFLKRLRDGLLKPYVCLHGFVQRS